MIEDTYNVTTGIVILCSLEGAIIQVIRDELGVRAQLPPGKAFNFVVDRGSFGKSLNFLHELRTHGSAFDWQLNMSVNGEITTLSFGGIVMEDHLVILGANSGESVKRLHEELLQINNEQMNLLRTMIKDRAIMKQAEVSVDEKFYDELSRLNNELATLQRELAQKNVILEAQQRQLQEKNAQLCDLNADKDRFFSIISHDLRSPFVTLLGYIQRVAQQVHAGEQKQLEYNISKLQGIAERIHVLLENLLTWSRIQRGAMEFDPEYFSLQEIIEDLLALFSLQAEQKQITLDYSDTVEEDVYADYQMVNTILRNLISNALKFTPSGGRIDVRAQASRAMVEVAVKDTGVGIPAEDLPHLFHRDGHYTNPGTAGEQGTGLGLNLCKELIERHGGTIRVESESGAGTTFRFTLPRQAKHESETN